MHIFQTKSKLLIQSVYPVEIVDTHDYLMMHQEGQVKGLFEIQPITKITGMVHMHIKEEHQNQGIGIDAFNALLMYLRGRQYKQLIGPIPEHNTRIQSIVNKTLAKECGRIKDGIVYDNKLQDLILYQLEIK